jgi:hypothetical protein
MKEESDKCDMHKSHKKHTFNGNIIEKHQDALIECLATAKYLNSHAACSSFV